MLPHVHVYASLRPPRLECPYCGFLILFGHAQPHEKHYHAPTSRLKCPQCTHAYYLGLVVWDAPKGRSGEGPPDVIVGPRQLAAIRQYGGGFWTQEKYQKGEPIHVVEEARCRCAPLPWRPQCPVHGHRRGMPEDAEPDTERQE